MADRRRFFIVRHGNTFESHEPARRIGARSDVPLTAEGERQARSVGHWLATQGIEFEAAYSGPLSRSRRTAELVLAEQPTPPPIVGAHWLDEIDHGPDEGRLEAEVIARVGRAALSRWDREAIAPPQWEVQCMRRIVAWQELFEARRTGDVLLATSNGAARFALLAMGRPWGMPSMKLRTGAMGIITVGTDGDPVVAGWDLKPDD